jgi:uncharacterized DUF497 family protein
MQFIACGLTYPHIQTIHGHRVRRRERRNQLEKHGISLARAADFEGLAYVADTRFAKPRFRRYGTIDSMAYCLAGTDRNGIVRVISLRRAPARKMRRYVE